MRKRFPGLRLTTCASVFHPSGDHVASDGVWATLPATDERGHAFMNARARRAIRPIATAVAVAAMFAGAACGAPEAPGGGGTGNTAAPTDAASVPDKPSKPVTLDILDVAGNLQLTQAMIDDFVANNKDVVSRVTYQKATGPETAGKIKAQQDGGNVQTDLVLTGNDEIGRAHV